MPRSKVKISKTKFKKYYDLGMNDREISNNFNVSRKTITNRRNEWGLPPNPYIPTNETRKKLSIRLSGRNNPRFGAVISKETREKIGNGNRGKIISQQQKEKLAKALRGNKNPNWQGGKTKLQESIRKCFKYKEWRNKCYERDNYTCQICNKHGGNLNADHIKSFATILKYNNIKTVEVASKCKELWDTNNGRTLCEKCHRIRHSGRINGQHNS